MLSQIITKVNTTHGAPIGRPNVGTQPRTITSGPNARIVNKLQTKVYNRRVTLDKHGYDKGGAYWGVGGELRVFFTKDLSYIEFWRNPN